MSFWQGTTLRQTVELVEERPSAILTLMEVKDLSQIHYAPYNPRTLSDHMGNSLDASMTTFGDISGITNNIQTDTLVTGHQRLRILEKRYPGRVKVYVEHRFEAPDEYGTVATGFVGVEGTNLHLAYREVSWELGKEKAANVGANKIEAQFDNDLLAQVDFELSQLENGAELLALTGQSDKEIEKLLQSVGAGDDPEPPADDQQDEAKNEKLTFALSPDQREVVELALAQAKSINDIPHTNLDNINGTALYYISKHYAETATSQNAETSSGQAIDTPAADTPPDQTASQTFSDPSAPDLTSIPTDAAA
jgi:hypothetical protein